MEARSKKSCGSMGVIIFLSLLNMAREQQGDDEYNNNLTLETNLLVKEWFNSN
jgi:hypothetical protein